MIAIKNMSMPKSCEDCRCTFDGFDGSTCILGAKRIDWTKRPKDCPLVEPERPQGEWIYKEFDVESGISHSYWCTNCGEPKSQWCDDFCQRCGADMRKGGAE